jgi:hypothetical protein
MDWERKIKMDHEVLLLDRTLLPLLIWSRLLVRYQVCFSLAHGIDGNSSMHNAREFLGYVKTELRKKGEYVERKDKDLFGLGLLVRIGSLILGIDRYRLGILLSLFDIAEFYLDLDS